MRNFSLTPMEASATACACAVVFMCIIIVFNLGRADALARCKVERLSYATPFKGGFEQ